MKTQIIRCFSCSALLLAGIAFWASSQSTIGDTGQLTKISNSGVVPASATLEVSQTDNSDVIVDDNVMLCQGTDTQGYDSLQGVVTQPAAPKNRSQVKTGQANLPVQQKPGQMVAPVSGFTVDGQGCAVCDANTPNPVPFGAGFGYGNQSCGACGDASCTTCNTGGRSIRGVNGGTRAWLGQGREAGWKNANQVPWEEFAYGEYVGPHRTPHVPIYRLRVNDQLEFVYLRTREKSLYPYQLFVGDTISIVSAIDPSLSQQQIVVQSDGMISLSLIGQVQAAGKTIQALQDELNNKYTKFVKNPAIVVQVNQGNTPLQDLVDAVDARAGIGGQSRLATVAPDGTIQLPGIGSVPAIGLTLDEMAREVNARYRLRQGGIEVTPVLVERAARFIYVVGQVGQPGRFELTGPTTALQALALAQGTGTGGNERQVVVFRRDQDWRLVATKLDLKGALLGKKPYPSDDIWLRDGDIVLVPRMPIQRLSEAINLYFTNTLYSLFPAELGGFDAGAIIN